MSDYLGYYVGDGGYKLIDPDGYPMELAPEFESSEPAALDVPTIDVEPESVRDTEIHREIES